MWRDTHTNYWECVYSCAEHQIYRILCHIVYNALLWPLHEQ